MLVFLARAIEFDPKPVRARVCPKRRGCECTTLIVAYRATAWTVGLPCLFEKSAVQALSSTQPRSNLLRAILLAGEWGSMSGGFKETSDTDPTIFVVSKPKLSNMRALEQEKGRSVGQRVDEIQVSQCVVPTQPGLECLSRHREISDFTLPYPIFYDSEQRVSAFSLQSPQHTYFRTVSRVTRAASSPVLSGGGLSILLLTKSSINFTGTTPGITSDAIT